MNIYTIIGMTFVFAVSITVITICLCVLFHLWRIRKETHCEELVSGICHQIDRWCDYEFPQAGFTARSIRESIYAKRMLDADGFRDELRNQFLPTKEIK